MKKTKLSLSLIACLLSVGALAGCDKKIKSSSDGVLLTYTVDGKEYKVTADDILGKYYDDSTKYSAIYDTIYSVIVKNYFTKDIEEVTFEGQNLKLGLSQMEKIKKDAQEKVDEDIDSAHENADANKTKYKKELQAILSSKGVETTEELKDYYVAQLQKDTFEKNFYTYFMDIVKGGDESTKLEEKVFWNGYFEDQMPYHVSHVLVELADTSDTNYHNGTISEDNATRLFNVVNAIALGDDSFSKIAQDYSEDEGSAVNSGDLGIMDYGTGFIDEFKLGIYAYEKFYRKNETNIANPNFATDESINKKFIQSVQGSFDGEIPEIKFKTIEELNKVASVDKDEDGEAVMDNSTLVYPRNIMYNKYINKHSVCFITNDSATPLDVATTEKKSGWVEQQINTYDSLGEKQTEPVTKKVLSVKVNGEWQPVLAVRASSQGKQEMHLMVINRSPFHAASDAIPLKEYYTTYYPKQPSYPVDDSGNPKLTYINFVNGNDVTATRTRAEEFASKLKSYDSDRLGKYIFLRYMKKENVKFTEESGKLESALMKWISTSVEKESTTRKDAWKETWSNYIDKLERQNSERKKLIPEACRIVYKKANKNTVISTEFAAEIEAIKKSLKEDYGLSDAEITKQIGKKVNEWFNVKKGVCNDGSKHE